MAMACLFLFSCDAGVHYAPVSDISDLASIQVPNNPTSKWIWPAKGKIIMPFSASNKGIDIAGIEGEAVYAAAAGTVVYSGEGLRGYGKLIILKHNNIYLSAYAHNKIVFVKVGQRVKQGQKIAEMGNTGSDKTMLHFEIRKLGVPVNPLSLLAS